VSVSGAGRQVSRRMNADRNRLTQRIYGFFRWGLNPRLSAFMHG